MQPTFSALAAVSRADERLSRQVCAMRELEHLESDAARRAALLAAALDRCASSRDDALVYLPGGLDAPRAFGEGDENAGRLLRVWRRALRMTDGLSPAARDAVHAHLRASGLLRRAEIECELARLRNRHAALRSAYRKLAEEIQQAYDISSDGHDPGVDAGAPVRREAG